MAEGSKDPKIRVVVRKRPLNSKERARNEIDILETRSPQSVVVKEGKLKVDLTRFIEEHHFTFDNAFDETVTNQELYQATVLPLVSAAFQGTKITCFAYGQTGSGKTFTMMGEERIPGLYLLAANELFVIKNANFKRHTVWVSFYEIYCGKLFDLLNGRQALFAREDAKQTVNIVGLQRRQVQDVHSLMQIISFGMSMRTVGVTGANDDSSRSHGVLEIDIKDGTKTLGKMSFIDLAGSERGADVTDSDKQTR